MGSIAAVPEQVVSTPGQRLFAMLHHVYFAPPAFWDVGNCTAQTRACQMAYLAAPLQTGWHTTDLNTNPAAGGAMLALSLAGMAWQRWCLPQVPLACRPTGFGLVRLTRPLMPDGTIAGHLAGARRQVHT